MSEAGRRVRVCDDAVFLVFARRAAGQAAGHPFFGSFLWSEQRNERKRFEKILLYPFFAAQRMGTPKKKRPGVSRPPAADSFDGHICSGVAMNSHIRALKQHDDPAPL